MCALRFLDSFDHYTTILQKWTDRQGGSIGAAYARTGAQGCWLPSNNDYITLTIDAQDTWIIGEAWRSGNVAAGNGPIISTRDAGTTQGALQVNAVGTLSLLRGGVVVATSIRSLFANVFYYIEFKHIIDNVAGLLEARVDGAVWATFVGDTQNTANATADQIRLNGHWNACDTSVDDLYILDGVDQSIADPNSPPNNNYWGDTQVECRVPNGAGTYAEFNTLVGAASHWQACNEVPPNEDTSYVDTPDVDDRDTFAFQDLSVVSATIPGIQVLIRARKTAAGAASMARMYRRAAVDNQGADVALQESYAYIREIMGGDPIGAGAWTVAALNAAEFGARAR